MSDEKESATTVTTHIVIDTESGRREHRHVQTIPDSCEGCAAAAISENAALAILNFYGPVALANLSQRMQRPLVQLAQFFETAEENGRELAEEDYFDQDDED